MELHYLNPTHTLIVAHLDAGETLGTLTEGTSYIKVDGTDPNYLALVEKDPTLESVSDPGAVRMPPPASPPVEPPPPAAPPAGESHAHEEHAHGQKKAK